MVLNIRHTGIVVENLRESLQFYQDKLGFTIDKEMDECGSFIDTILGYQDTKVTTVKLSLGNDQMVELLDFSSHKQSKLLRRLTDIGPTHLAFTVYS